MEMPEPEKKEEMVVVETVKEPDPIEHIIHNIEDGTENAVVVKFTDTKNPEYFTTKTINLFDITSQEELDERINNHKRTFLHRISIGVIQPQEKTDEIEEDN